MLSLSPRDIERLEERQKARDKVSMKEDSASPERSGVAVKKPPSDLELVRREAKQAAALKKAGPLPRIGL